MSGENGSTSLSQEQQSWFQRKFGVRYHAVQTNADIPNRRTRRALKKRRGR